MVDMEVSADRGGIKSEGSVRTAPATGEPKPKPRSRRKHNDVEDDPTKRRCVSTACVGAASLAVRILEYLLIDCLHILRWPVGSGRASVMDRFRLAKHAPMSVRRQSTHPGFS